MLPHKQHQLIKKITDSLINNENGHWLQLLLTVTVSDFVFTGLYRFDRLIDFFFSNEVFYLNSTHQS